jgi:hemerythrin superfamily protein
MGILEELKKDHEEVKSIFEQMVSGGKQNEKMFDKLKEELTNHSKAEEKVLYSALRKEDAIKEMVLEGYEEHHVANVVLRELDRNKRDGERWSAKLKVLQEIVEHHVEDEEGEIFPETAQIFPADKLEELAAQFQEEKKKLRKK